MVNIGDGFILRAIERLVGTFSPRRTFSSRVAPSHEAQTILEECSAVILAGANQLDDDYTVWPGLTPDRIRQGKLRFVPFGIGLHGAPDKNVALSQASRAVLEALHERIEFSSWRCSRTVAVLRRELPHLAERFLMTGCPVVYDRLLLEGNGFNGSEASVVVTATERHDFLNRETKVLDVVAKRFRASRLYFVIHQNVSPPTLFEGLRHRFMARFPRELGNQVEALRLYARRLGFKVVIPRDTDECLRLYGKMDVHVGTRLHAHLLFLSQNKRSYLVPVDGRSVGIAADLGFPLSLPEQLSANWDCDFEVVRRRARESFQVMTRFVSSL